MVGINTHDCSTCALHRKKTPARGTLEYTIDEDDCRVYSRIQIMLSNAAQAADPTALNNLPEDVSDENKSIFIDRALKNLEDAKALLAEWWTVMLHKYELPSLAVKLDEVNKYFYTCNDDNDVPSLNGEYVPKKTSASKGCCCSDNVDTPCSCYVL